MTILGSDLPRTHLGRLTTACSRQCASRAPRLALAVMLITVIGVTACNDDRVIAPRSITPHGRQQTELPPGGAFSMALPSTLADGGGFPLTGTGVNVPAGSFLRLRISDGLIVHTSCGSPPEIDTITPNGIRTVSPPLFAVMWSVGGSSIQTGFTRTGSDFQQIVKATYFSGELAIGRTQWSVSFCDQLSGNTQTVQIDFVDAALTASDSSVTKGQSVHFIATPNNVTAVNTFWEFHPDSGGRILLDGCAGALSCDYSPQFGGSMLFSLSPLGGGGLVDATSPHVAVVSTIDLNINPSASAFVGDTLTYTATAHGGGTLVITSWQWVQDSAPPKGYVEKKPISACGTAATCRHTPGVSGWIRVYGKVNGVADSSAKTHVTMSVKFCTGDDPLLDIDSIRVGIKDVWKASNADQDTAIVHHTELMAGAYRQPDGSVFVQQIPGPTTPCGWDGDSVPQRVGTAVLIVTLHPHPFHWDALYPAVCRFPAGAKYNNPNGVVNALNGRASGEDWKLSKKLQVPGFIIDYDGIYKYDGTTADIDTTTSITIVKNGPNFYRKWDRFDTAKVCSRP